MIPPVRDALARTGPGALNPAALTVAHLARLLGVAEQTIRRHVAAGAPASADGRVNLVRYSAWLNRELAAPGASDGD